MTGSKSMFTERPCRLEWRELARRSQNVVEDSSVRFHDGWHTAITTLAEKGLLDWVIQAQVGHVAPEI